MKKLLYFLFIALCCYSCKKETDPAVYQDNPYLRTVLSHLKDSLPVSDYQALDTNNVYLTDPANTDNYLLRIGLKGKSIASDFLLVRTDKTGDFRLGTIVHLENTTPALSYEFSGNLSLRSLSGKENIRSAIIDGHILSLHTGNRLTITTIGQKEITVLPAPDADWLPEVVVVGYSGGSPPTPYISLDALLGGVGNGDIGINAGSSSGDPNSGGSGGSGSGSGNTAPANPVTPPPYSPQDPVVGPLSHSFSAGIKISTPLQFEPEYIYNLPVVNVQRLFACFDLIPDAGASYSVQLCVDVPLNGNPAASSNTFAFSAGHTFLVVNKTTGGQSVTQCFGYYPTSTISAWNPYSPISSVIRDNSRQEINGSLTMYLTKDQFSKLRDAAVNLATQPYMLDQSNCTDYALNVFNTNRMNPIVLPPYIINQPAIVFSGAPASPGYTVTIKNSPQQLYEQLNSMKTTGQPEASNIRLDLTHNYISPNGHGECH